MSLSSLPSVLAQSIAHSLTTKERLRLARCSRRNRTLAEAPFAWLHADPIPLDIDGRGLSSGPLLRFIPIRLFWRKYSMPHSVADRVSRLIAIADRSHVVAIQFFQKLDDALMSRILQAPSVLRLQSLSLWGHTRRQIELVCQLPLLATLVLASPLSTADASLLSPAPSLTDLTVTNATSDPGSLASVLQCSKLRRLAVSGFRVADLPAFSQEPRWQQLRELVVSPSAPWGLLSADTMAAAFSSLRSLLVLQLAGENLDPLLAHVRRIPTLRRLIIECDGLGLVVWSDSLSYSDDVLLSLLRSSPTLNVDWLAAPLDSERLESLLRPLIAELGAQLIHSEEQISHSARSRFRLVRAA